jgi:F-type H+-transporting ATPase subunit a
MKRITISPETIFSVGPVQITDTVITTWIVITLISVISFIATRRLTLRPSVFQEVLEAAFEAVETTVKEVLPVEPWEAVPVLGTIWILIGFSNLIGLLPGLRTPTADLNTTFAFAVISYSMTHVFGIKTRGMRGYLSHYKEPTWVLLPIHLMAEVTRTVALAVRLFGNMLSGEMIAVILLGIVGFLAPIPFDLLHLVIGLIQAYIFGVLTLVFIAIGITPEG